jgi:hypothetical protein
MPPTPSHSIHTSAAFSFPKHLVDAREAAASQKADGERLYKVSPLKRAEPNVLSQDRSLWLTLSRLNAYPPTIPQAPCIAFCALGLACLNVHRIWQPTKR